MSRSKNTKRVALFGAAPDTPNMGVSALFMSTVTGLNKCIDNLEVVVFDNGLGVRKELLSIDNNKTVQLIRCGARGGHRYYRPENLFTMLSMSKLGRLGAILNKGIALIDSCDAVLDVSGGDSFSDIYGLERFNNINRPKQIAINRKKKLILLPQTYGPYKDKNVKDKAASSVKNASIAWARDEDSYKILIDLLGESFSSDQHRCGVDMAFGLHAINPGSLLSPSIHHIIYKKTKDSLVVGINISGLIYNDVVNSAITYGFKVDYKKIINKLISWLLENTNSKIILISHVMNKPGHYESDIEACFDAKKNIRKEHHNRIYISPLGLNQSHTKWLISKLDWFCGTRMHSTIASLSTFVPTCTIAYSDKAKGVFSGCGQGKYVFDPRCDSEETIMGNLIKSYRERDSTRKHLKEKCQSTLDKENMQMVDIVEFIMSKNP